jgi:hypothetical protein
VTPAIIIVRVGDKKTGLSDSLKRQGIPFDSYEPKGNDYYGLTGLIPLLSRKSKLDLVYEIMDFPLPSRKSYV